RLYEGQSVRLDRLTQRLQQQMQTLYYEKEKQTRLLRHRLEQQIPLSKVREAQVRLNYNHQNLQQQMANVLQRKWQQFDKEIQALNLLSPLNIMGRGYSYTVDKKGTVVSSVQQLTLGEEVTIRYQDGQAQMKILTLEEKSHE
ncbi:MAG: exodeoxyribonuclease VII large subunit, partial [Enterococcus lemanii]